MFCEAFVMAALLSAFRFDSTKTGGATAIYLLYSFALLVCSTHLLYGYNTPVIGVSQFPRVETPGSEKTAQVYRFFTFIALLFNSCPKFSPEFNGGFSAPTFKGKLFPSNSHRAALDAPYSLRSVKYSLSSRLV
jgi:hypothetical protein